VLSTKNEFLMDANRSTASNLYMHQQINHQFIRQLIIAATNKKQDDEEGMVIMMSGNFPLFKFKLSMLYPHHPSFLKCIL